MVYVRGNDAQTAVEIAPEATWGTDPGSGYLRVHPLVEESLFVERVPFARSREFGGGSSGALGVYDVGRQLIRGTFSVYPVYNGVWFGKLLGQVNGGIEIHNVGRLPNGTAPPVSAATMATHVYVPQVYYQTAANAISAIGNGFTIRVWKSGPTTAGSIDVYTGCIVTSMTWEQPPDERARVTFTFLGKGLTTIAASAQSLAAAQAGQIEVQMRDFKNRTTQPNCPGICQTGATLTEVNLRGFRFTIDGHYEAPPAFLTSLDSSEKPFHVDNWEATGEIQSLLEADYAAANRPYNEFQARIFSNVRFRYVSNSNVIEGDGSEAQRAPYAFDIYFPYVTWTAADQGIAEPGAIPTRWGFGTARDPVGITAFTWSGGSTQKVPWMLQTVSLAGAWGFATSGDPLASAELIPGSVSEAVPTTVSGTWTNGANATADGGGYASTTATEQSEIYSGYVLTDIPATAVIDGITVRLDALKEESGGSTTDGRITVDLSWDGGTSWSSTRATAVITLSEVTYLVGGPADMWGTHAWVRTDLTDTAKFRVRVKSTGTVVDLPEWRLDWVPVTVNYSTPQPAEG